MHPADRLRVLRRLAKASFGRDVSHRPEVSVPTKRFGSRYGGWTVCTHGLSSNPIVYSFGVGEDVTFDLEMIATFGMDVFAFDPTPRAVTWVASQRLPSQFHFRSIGIADHDGDAVFYAPKNPDFASYTIASNEGDRSQAVTSPVQRLSTIVEELGHERVDVLKLDIEGAEYGVIPDILNSRIPIGQLLVEFHHSFRSIEIGQTNDAVDLLRAHGFKLFAISPRGEEYSFIHRDRLR